MISAPSFPTTIAGPLSFCTNVNTTFSIPTITGANNYTWTVTRGLIIVSGQGTKSIIVKTTVPVSGQTMTVKASNACGTTNVRVLDNIASTNCPRIGDQTTSLNLIAYPNPVSDILTVGFNSSTDQNVTTKLYTVKLIDATGRVINTETNIANAGNNQVEMSVKGLASGLYLIQFQIGDHKEQIRIVVN